MAADQQALCGFYDQISDRTCSYFAKHRGRCNFARLDHNSALERELRRELDEALSEIEEALDLLDAAETPSRLAKMEAFRARVTRRKL